MKKAKKSEKLFLEEIFLSGKSLISASKGVEIGSLITLIRGQLKMSQKALASRSGMPQSTISRIESGRIQPNILTLKRIAEALICDLTLTLVPKQSLESCRVKQAREKAEKKIDYLKGTMSLEKQMPNKKLLSELVEDEIIDLLNSSGTQLWEDDK